MMSHVFSIALPEAGIEPARSYPVRFESDASAIPATPAIFAAVYFNSLI